MRKIFLLILIVIVFAISLPLLEITRIDQIGVHSSLYLCPTLKFLDRLPKILDISYLLPMLKGSDLSQYELEVDPKDLDKLFQKIPSCFSCSGRPTNKEIPAKFTAEGRTYSVQIGLRGFCADHWIHEKKSWRIIFPEENLYQGMKRVDLIVPVSRGFLTAELSQYRAKKLGLTVPDSRFVTLNINDQYYGLYWEVEAMSKNVLEKSGESSDVNLYRDDIPRGGLNIYQDVAYWNKKAENPADGIDNYAELDLLFDLINNTSDEEFNKRIPMIVDMGNLYRWHIHEKLFGSYRQTSDHNATLYFDRTMGKFKFIPEDAVLEPTRYKFFDLFSSPGPGSARDQDYNVLITRVLKNPDFVHERNRILWEYVKDDTHIKDDEKFFSKLNDETRWAVYRERRNTYSNFYYDICNHFVFKKIIGFYEAIRDKLQEEGGPSVRVKSNNIIDLDFTADNFSGIKLEELVLKLKSNTDSSRRFCLYRDSDSDGVFSEKDALIQCQRSVSQQNEVVFKDINTNFFAKREVSDSPPKTLLWFYVPNPIEVVPANHHLFLTVNPASQNLSVFDYIEDFDFLVSNAITGEEVKLDKKMLDFKNLDQIDYSFVDIDTFIRDNPQFRKISANKISLSSGEQRFLRTVIIPKGLTLVIPAGTTLKFAKDTSLFSYSPILAQGTQGLPVTFTSESGQPWGVVGIVNTGQRTSVFQNVVFENGGEDYLNGIFLSGQFSIYHSRIDISHSTFRLANGDDSVNIKNSDSEVSFSTFDQNKFDALDLDFNNSKILNCLFKDNGNDGIDISGGKPYIYGNKIVNSADKGISVGENSKAIIINNLIRQNAIGIAIKDSSDPDIINSTVVDNEIGISLFQKKAIFGGGKGEIFNSILWGNREEIKIDELSKVGINFSDIEGGWEGKDNTDADPLLNNDFESTNKSLLIDEEILSKFCSDCSDKNITRMGIF